MGDKGGKKKETKKHPSNEKVLAAKAGANAKAAELAATAKTAAAKASGGKK
jgi:hypothetical protein